MVKEREFGRSANSIWKSVMSEKSVEQKRQTADVVRFMSVLAHSDNLKLSKELAHGISGGRFADVAHAVQAKWEQCASLMAPENFSGGHHRLTGNLWDSPQTCVAVEGDISEIQELIMDPDLALVITLENTIDVLLSSRQGTTYNAHHWMVPGDEKGFQWVSPVPYMVNCAERTWEWTAQEPHKLLTAYPMLF